MTTIKQRERRDWALLIFLVPIGIMLIIIVGQLAVRMVPTWSVDAGMGSNLEPDSDSARPFALLQPILPQILTPVAWAESYLTPNGDVSFPPFLTFEPTATPSPTAVTPSPTEPTPTATTSPTSTVTITATSTPPTPTKTDTDEPDTPTSSATVSPSPTTPSPSPTTPSPSPTTPSPTGIISTMPPSYGTPAPIPSQVGVGTTPDNTNPSSDANVGTVLDGTYIVINLSVTVSSSPDGNYDLALYEYNNNGYVYMDWMIVGITNSPDGSQYYEVFNWGNGTPDNNSNVGDIAGSENDDQAVDSSEFYDPDGAGSAPQSGILIDVDTATSAPPPDTYNYVVVISPLGGTSGTNAQVDAIQTVEVPIPTPTP